jgi:heat shock protein HslJ
VASDSTPPAAALIGSLWNLTAYSDPKGSLVSVLPATQATATFGSTGFVTGSSGCNAYSTVFQTVATTLLFIGPVATTHLTCDQPVMDQEQAYLWALPRSTGYRLEGDHLVLIESDATRVAEYSR